MRKKKTWRVVRIRSGVVNSERLCLVMGPQFLKHEIKSF